MLLLCSILSLGFIATSMVGYFVARDSLTQQTSNDTLPLLGDNIYSEIQRDLLKPIIISSLMANDTFLRDWVLDGEQNPEQIQTYLKKIQTSYATVTSFFISDKTQKYYHPSGIVKSVSPDNANDAWYFRARKIDSTHEINIDFDATKNDALTVFINYKVMDANNKFIGITGVGLGLSKVQELIETYQEKYNREIFFVDPLGEITLNGSMNKKGINFSDIDINGKSLNQQLFNKSSASTRYRLENHETLINSRYLQEFNWYLIIRQCSDDLNKELFESLLLNLGISLLITIIILSFTWITLGSYQQKLEKMAITDKLTGLNNRQMFDPILEQFFKLATRNNSELAVAILDIDNFKRINDQHGHPFGDKVLVEVSNLLRKQTRSSDILCRWGGEEFLILMPTTQIIQAQHCIEQLHKALANQSFNIDGNEVYIQLSAGIAGKEDNDEPNTFIYRADQALLKAKSSGRNQTVLG
jgi:diguanylate cyclase (GGDEF)-like protein